MAVSLSLSPKLVPLAALRRLSAIGNDPEIGSDTRKAAVRVGRALELDEEPAKEDLALVMLYLLVAPVAAGLTARLEKREVTQRRAAVQEPVPTPAPERSPVKNPAAPAPVQVQAQAPTPAKSPPVAKRGGLAAHTKAPGRPPADPMDNVRVLRVEHTRVRIPVKRKEEP